MKMQNPTHPGILIKELTDNDDLLKNDLESSIFVPLRLLCDGYAGITVEMALIFESHGLGSAEKWLMMQMKYDLWNARNNKNEKK